MKWEMILLIQISQSQKRLMLYVFPYLWLQKYSTGIWLLCTNFAHAWRDRKVFLVLLCSFSHLFVLALLKFFVVIVFYLPSTDIFNGLLNLWLKTKIKACYFENWNIHLRRKMFKIATFGITQGISSSDE